MPIDTWTEWHSFPDPRTGDLLIAPFGPGCYEVRRISTTTLVLFEVGGHVAKRMSSLLPKPFGTGTRNNSAKRSYCLEHVADLEYRTRPCASRASALEHEKLMKTGAAYVFGT